MSDFTTQKTVYTPEDFTLWTAQKMLVLTPKFQRRPVWKPIARSFFIDTLLRGMTVPPLYLRLVQNEKTTSTIREVVDGQQRVRCVLDFMDDDYRLSKSLNAPWANKRFSDLTSDEQRRIKSFPLPTEVFSGINDQQVLQVFCRLNMNGIPLNKQEFRNGKYFGYFKEVSYSLAIDYLEFWRTHGLFTEQGIARMLEVQLTSELLIAGNNGMQDKKASIDTFYQRYEDAYADRERDTKRFRETMQAISETFHGASTLNNTAFHRPPLFYTLYCVVYHYQYGLPGSQRLSPKKRLTSDARESLRDAVENLSNTLLESKNATKAVNKRHAKFVAACARQTDNLLPRKDRFDSLYEETF